MKKKVLSLTLAVIFVLSSLSIPAFAAVEVATEILDTSNSDSIQFGSNGVFPESGSFVEKKSWGTDQALDAFNDGKSEWISTDKSGGIIFNTASIQKDQSVSIKHLVDSSKIPEKSNIRFSFDFKFLDAPNYNLYFEAGFNDYQHMPFYATPHDQYVGAGQIEYGIWGSHGANNTKKLSINTDYTFTADYTWNEEQQLYDMTYKVTNNSTTMLSNTITAEQFKIGRSGEAFSNDADIKALRTSKIESVSFGWVFPPQSTNYNYEDRDALSISNVKLIGYSIQEEDGKAEFYEASLSEPRTLINDVMAEQKLVHAGCDSGKDQYVNSDIEDADVLAGKKWYTNDMNSANEKTFLFEDDYITIRPFQTLGFQNFKFMDYIVACPKLVRCFTPVTDGSAFSVKTTLMPLKSSLPRDLGGGVISQMPIGFNVQLRLTNDEWNGLGNRAGDSSSVFNIFSYGVNQEEKSLAAVAGVNQTAVNVASVNHESSNFAAKTSLSYDIPLHGKEIVVEAKFIPAGNNYDVTVTCTDTDGNVLLTNTSPVTLSKETVAGYNRFQISATFDGCVEMTQEQAALRYMKIKEVSIATTSNETLLKEGANKIYIPYKMTSGDKFDASVIAAIYNGEGQESFVIKELKDCTEKNGSVCLDINITDPDNQYVRYFVFDSFETLRSICNAKNPLYVQK